MTGASKYLFKKYMPYYNKDLLLYQPHSSFCVVESHYFICLTVNMKMLSLIIIIIVQAEMRNDGLYFISVRTSSARR